MEQLTVAIGDYIDRHNQNPKPFIWDAKAKDIAAGVIGDSMTNVMCNR